MPKFVVERHIPGVGSRSDEDLEKTARRFEEVAGQIGSGLSWVMGYVTNDTMYCVLSSPDADLIRFHGLRAGFPADQISEVRQILSPTKTN